MFLEKIEKMPVILGPTATGKTTLAVQLARKLGGEILSADSRQVYRGMDIGTGKDLEEYGSGSDKVPVHLIDIADPSEEYNLYRWQQDFFVAHAHICQRQTRPILCGGTGMYLESILANYNLSHAPEDPEWRQQCKTLSLEELKKIAEGENLPRHNKTDFCDRSRLIRAIEIHRAPRSESRAAIETLNIGIAPKRELLKKRIEKRLRQRLQSGMLEECEALLDAGTPHEKLEFFGLEYRYLSRYLRKELNYNDMFQQLRSAIWKFSKRQMTFLRRMEKRGIGIHWFESIEEAWEHLNEPE